MNEPHTSNPQGMPNIRASGAQSGSARGAMPSAAVPITWAGSPWSLVGLSIINFLLGLVTLGIYSFWGKTEVRRRVWSFVRLQGEPLEYTGTGKELFLGFLIVLGAVFVPMLLFSLAGIFAFGQRAAPVVQLILYVVVFYLIGVAIYRARNYRLSRTRWRGIRGALTGSSWGYGWSHFWTALLVPFTLGWVVPWRATKLQRRLTDDMNFGDQPFRFSGSSGPLYKRYAIRWFGVIVLSLATAGAIYLTVGNKLSKFAAPGTTAGPPKPPQLTNPEIAILVAILVAAFFIYSIITAWYRASQANIFAAATHYDNAAFRLHVTARGLIWLFITNFGILLLGAAALALIGAWAMVIIKQFAPVGAHMALVTGYAALLGLGILKPVVEARATKYFIDRLALDGAVNWDAVAQSNAAMSRTGEGLAQAFDVDAF